MLLSHLTLQIKYFFFLIINTVFLPTNLTFQISNSFVVPIVLYFKPINLLLFFILIPKKKIHHTSIWTVLHFFSIILLKVLTDNILLTTTLTKDWRVFSWSMTLNIITLKDIIISKKITHFIIITIGKRCYIIGELNNLPFRRRGRIIRRRRRHFEYVYQKI